jgi:hypothetical protein
LAGSETSVVSDVPSSKETVTRASPGTADVLATSTYVSASRRPPCSPSASAHKVPVVVAPGALCASAHVAAVGPGHHIVRSAITGRSAVIVVDSAAWARSFGHPGICSTSTQML